MKTSEIFLSIIKNNPSIAYQDLAKLMNVSPSCISYYARKFNMMRRIFDSKYNFSTSQIKKICWLYESGITSRKISIKYKVSPQKIINLLRDNNITIKHGRAEYQKFKYYEDFFHNIDCEEKAYYLGLLYADGNISSVGNSISITLQEKDAYILESLKNSICKNPKKLNKIISANFKGFGFSVSSRQMKNDLIMHGCIPRKTFKITLPNLSEELMPHFIRGYFDGDGCFSIIIPRKHTGNQRAIFHLVSNTEFCLQLGLYIMMRLSVYIGIYNPTKNLQVGSVQTGNDQTILKLYKYLYNTHTICLHRKRDKMSQYLKCKNLL